MPSLVATTYSNFHILLIDNASTDASVAFVQQHYPQIQVEVMPTNLGFAKGNNAALQYVNTPFYVLLNTDVELTPGWLTALMQTAEQNPSCAAVQPKILWHKDKTVFEYAGAAGGWVDDLAYTFCRGRVFDTLEKDTLQYENQQQVFWASGACMLIRKEVSDTLGLFDEALWAHWEEIDFCWRAQNAGWQIFVNPQSVVYHVGGGALSYDSPRKTYLNYRNSLVSMAKNLHPGEAFGKVFTRMVLDGVAGIRGLLKGQFWYFKTIAQSHIGFYKMLPHVFRTRKGKSFRRIKDLAGVYHGSVVWGYFAKKKHFFSDFVGEK